MDWLNAGAYAVAVLLIGGGVKGVFGIGLPLAAMPLLTLVFSVPVAGGILVAPLVATNLVQSFGGGWEAVKRRLRRHWLICVLVTVTMIPASQLVVIVPERLIFATIGAVMLVMSLLTFFKPSFRVSPGQERWIGPIVAVISGLLGGLTTFYGPPLMLYVLSLRLPRDEFVGDISLLYLVAGAAFGVGLGGAGAFDLQLMLLSCAAVIPTFIGNWAGLKVRLRMNERDYSVAVFGLYLVVSASFLGRAVW